MIEWIINLNPNPSRLYGYRKFKNFLLYVFIHIFLIFILYNLFMALNDSSINNHDKYKIIFISGTAISIMLLYYQSRKTLDWNRRQLTAVEIAKYVESNKESRTILNTLVNYSSRFNTKIPFTDTELHKWMCEYNTLENGDINFVREDSAKEHPYKFKIIQKYKTKNGEKELVSEVKVGAEIRGSIIKILNNYEMIAINVLNGAFDESMVKDTLLQGFTDNFFMFKNYIEHLRGYDHYNDIRAYEHIQWLAERWEVKRGKRNRNEP